ncbi:MAG: hypothetical protein ACP5DX_05635 [Paracoccaceae bacterium]
MQDKTIDNALLALRKQIIRSDGDGLEHVEALLRMRGVDMPRVLPAMPENSARRGQMAFWIMEALRDGPKPRREIAARICDRRPDAPPEALYWRVDAALSRLRKKGMVRRDGREWFVRIPNTMVSH